MLDRNSFDRVHLMVDLRDYVVQHFVLARDFFGLHMFHLFPGFPGTRIGAQFLGFLPKFVQRFGFEFLLQFLLQFLLFVFLVCFLFFS